MYSNVLVIKGLLVLPHIQRSYTLPPLQTNTPPPHSTKHSTPAHFSSTEPNKMTLKSLAIIVFPLINPDPDALGMYPISFQVTGL